MGASGGRGGACQLTLALFYSLNLRAGAERVGAVLSGRLEIIGRDNVVQTPDAGRRPLYRRPSSEIRSFLKRPARGGFEHRQVALPTVVEYKPASRPCRQ